jgi:hypothetical protein
MAVIRNNLKLKEKYQFFIAISRIWNAITYIRRGAQEMCEALTISCALNKEPYVDNQIVNLVANAIFCLTAEIVLSDSRAGS